MSELDQDRVALRKAAADHDETSRPTFSESMNIIAKRVFFSNLYIYYHFLMVILNLLQVLLLFRPWTGSVHLDLEPASTKRWERDCFLALETVISLLLISEVILKISWYGRREFFYGLDWCINLLDLVLAIACGAILVMFAAGLWDGALETRVETRDLDSDALISLTLAVVLRVVMRIVRLAPAARQWRRIRELNSADSQVRFGSFLLGEETGDGRARSTRWMDWSVVSDGDGESIPYT
jgi:hypothetical protein